MLAGTEEAVHARKPFEVSDGKSAIETLLAGLIDYAGLYPPASLDMGSAVENYRAYRSGKHAFALGRFIVDINRMDELLAGPTDRQFVETRSHLLVMFDGLIEAAAIRLHDQQWEQGIERGAHIADEPQFDRRAATECPLGTL